MPSVRFVALAIAALLASDVGAFVVLGRRVEAVSVTEAVERYRQLPAEKKTGQEEAAPSSVSGVADIDTQTRAAATSAQIARGSRSKAAAPGAAKPDSPTAVAAARPTRTPPGVYVYSTRGYEEVSVLDTRHTYPSETTMTVNSTGCGMDVRWDALEERWAAWSFCAAGSGEQLRHFTTHHEFFSQINERRYECAPGTWFRPDSQVAGHRFRGKCTDEDATVEIDGRVVAVEPVTVDGQRVDTIHVRIDETLTGGTKGTRTSDSWYAVRDGLLLRRTSRTEVDTHATFGWTHYVEEVSLHLESLRPKR